MVVHYAEGSIQPLRMDNRENEFDSGIRVTCAYHLVPSSLSHRDEKYAEGTKDLSPLNPVAQLLYSVSGLADEDKQTADKVPVNGRKQCEGMRSLGVENDQ